jgi:xylulokinase
MPYVLACDLGGTSLRAGLVDAAGGIAHIAAGAGPAIIGRKDGLETDAQAWWDQLCAAIETLARTSGDAFGSVRAIAITGVTRTQILLDDAGRVLRPAMTWGDTRAGPLVPELEQALADGHPEHAALNAFHPVARLAWLQCHEPDVFQATAAVLEPKDYFNFRLTGTVATDRISSARLIAAAQPAGAGSMLDALGIDPGLVPPILEPTQIVGAVRGDLPGALGRLAGLPVMCMAHDTWASVLGLGALRDRFAYNLSGTTEVLGVLSHRQAAAEGLLSVDWGGGLHQLGGPSQNGADTLVWALGLLSARPVSAKQVGGELDRVLAETRQSQPVVFLPHLQGERTPYWNPDLRGAFVGLNRRHTAVDCAHAVLEGIAFLNRTVLCRAEAATGLKVMEIRFGGGGAANARWCAIKADICERPVVVTDCSEPGLLGGAIVAWTALGAIGSIEEGQENLVKVAHRFEPDRTRGDQYRHLYELFQQTEAALAPISESLARIGGKDGA